MTELSEFPIVVPRSIAWGEMDAFQHVNNVHYFRFFEDARIAYFEAMDIYRPTEPVAFGEVGPILAATSCRFKAPLTYPDDIEVGARVDELDADQFVFEYAIRSETHDRIVATGDSEVVPYDYTEGTRVDVPDDWREAIEHLEG